MTLIEKLETTDYYTLLQVDPTATQAQLQQAYKRLALIWHPDLSIHPTANQQMQLLNEAYAVLINSEKRAEYDRRRLAEAAQSALTRVESASSPLQNTAPAGPAKAVSPPVSLIDIHKRRQMERQWRAWLVHKLKILALAILYTLILFAWALIWGELNIILVILLLAPVLGMLIILLRWIRRPTH